MFRKITRLFRLTLVAARMYVRDKDRPVFRFESGLGLRYNTALQVFAARAGYMTLA
ncbi:MAG: hypothetical protein GDA35_01520 [Hyphomonadaceae bacterium]|nr:hypothetical protein [Hyphomonadaceae bacterium]